MFEGRHAAAKSYQEQRVVRFELTEEQFMALVSRDQRDTIARWIEEGHSRPILPAATVLSSVGGSGRRKSKGYEPEHRALHH